MKSTIAFKQFLTDHQQVMKKHEAKKEKLVGSNNTTLLTGRVGSWSRRNGGGQAKKMKILP
jgi:hypothetical protein